MLGQQIIRGLAIFEAWLCGQLPNKDWILVEEQKVTN